MRQQLQRFDNVVGNVSARVQGMNRIGVPALWRQMGTSMPLSSVTRAGTIVGELEFEAIGRLSVQYGRRTRAALCVTCAARCCCHLHLPMLLLTRCLSSSAVSCNIMLCITRRCSSTTCSCSYPAHPTDALRHVWDCCCLQTLVQTS